MPVIFLCSHDTICYPSNNLRTNSLKVAAQWHTKHRTAHVCGAVRPMEATTGFEPVVGILQTPALPLGYVA